MRFFSPKFFCVALMLLGTLISGRIFAATFTRTLTMGDSGEDVRALQVLLNTSADTRVAGSGPGSPGNETTYFGELTAAAVSRYQEKYAAEILTPLNLSSGTGFAGTKTLTRLNGGIAPTPSSPATNGVAQELRNISDVKFGGSNSYANVTQSGTSDTIGDVKITSINPTHGPAGTSVTLTGVGFTDTNNTLYAGAKTKTVSSENGVITFTVEEPFPNNLEIPNFLREQHKSLTYGFVVENENGKSNQVLFTLELTD